MRHKHGSAGRSGGPNARPWVPDSRRRGIGRRLTGTAILGTLFVTTACNVGVGVDIDVAENGSGLVSVGVSLDRAASDALGDVQIDLEDLALAGWEVSGPAREADNLLWLRASKPFGSAEELPSILAEIAGPEVFREFELRRRAEFAEQTWEVVGQVEPAAALPELFDTLAFNQGLRERIVRAAGEFGGAAPLYGVNIRLSIDLPGNLRSGGGDFTWTAPTEDSPAPPVQVQMVSTAENTTAKTLRLVGLAAAALFILALLLNFVGWWYVRRHRKLRTRAVLARAGTEQLPTATAGPATATGDGQDDAPPTEQAGPAGLADTGADFEFAQTAGDFVTSESAGRTADLDDDVDWEELSSAEHDDLSAVEDLDDLTAADTAASADDWTASLEEPYAGGAPEEEPETDDAETDDGEPEGEPESEPEADGGPEPESEPEAEPTPEGEEPEEGAATAVPPPSPTAPTTRSLRLVAIGGWGVLFQPADPAGELLIPFVREAGSSAGTEDIREAHRLATLGRLTPGQLWEACGLSGEPAWHHGPYTGRMTVAAGAADLIRSLLQRDIGVACVTNDISEWSWRLRAWTGFEAVSPWVVSSDIGLRKPDPGVFEMLRRASEVPFANCLLIDSDRRTLDAARSLGMSTALFGAPVTDQPSIGAGHPAVGDFTDLLRRT